MDVLRTLSTMSNQSDSAALLVSKEHNSATKKEGLLAKFRPFTGSKVIDDKLNSSSSLENLSPESQTLYLRAYEIIRHEHSKDLLATLDESRVLLRDSLEEFQRDQVASKKQLEQIAKQNRMTMARQRENSIPISIFLRQKHDAEHRLVPRPNLNMNPTYEVYSEALLTVDEDQPRSASDRAAVIKYIRRRERRKQAEENRKKYELTSENLEKQTADLIERMDTMDLRLEHEKLRQKTLLQAKMNEKKAKTQNIIEVKEILDQAHEADLTRQRAANQYREKIEARLSTVREQHNRTPVNVIHVESHFNNGADDYTPLNDK